MPERYRVAETEDLSEDGDRIFAQLDGVEVAVFRLSGEFYAVANYCVHQSGPLCEGKLQGNYDVEEDGWEWTFDSEPRNIMCPWHGWKFDITTGDSISDERYAIPTYDVEVEDDVVYVVR